MAKKRRRNGETPFQYKIYAVMFPGATVKYGTFPHLNYAHNFHWLTMANDGCKWRSIEWIQHRAPSILDDLQFNNRAMVKITKQQTKENRAELKPNSIKKKGKRLDCNE